MVTVPYSSVVDGLLEDLDALGVLDLDRGLGLHRLQLGIQGDQPHLDGLARLVDGLVGLEKEERARPGSAPWPVLEKSAAADLDLVLARRRPPAARRSPCPCRRYWRCPWRSSCLVVENRDGHVASGRLVTLGEREREGGGLPRPQHAWNQGDVAVDPVVELAACRWPRSPSSAHPAATAPRSPAKIRISTSGTTNLDRPMTHLPVVGQRGETSEMGFRWAGSAHATAGRRRPAGPPPSQRCLLLDQAAIPPL